MLYTSIGCICSEGGTEMTTRIAHELENRK